MMNALPPYDTTRLESVTDAPTGLSGASSNTLLHGPASESSSFLLIIPTGYSLFTIPFLSIISGGYEASN